MHHRRHEVHGDVDDDGVVQHDLPVWVAFHEAGHAVSAALLGVPFAYATLAVLEDEDRDIDLPNVWQPEGPWKTWMSGGAQRDRETRLINAFKSIVSMLCGPVVESECRGLPLVDVLAESGQLDLEHATMIAEKIAGASRKNRVLAAALTQARRLLSSEQGRRAVLRVGVALHERGRLEHDDVLRLVQEPPPSDDVDAISDSEDVVVLFRYGDEAGAELREQLRRVLSR